MCLLRENNSMASPLLLAIRNGESTTAKSILLHGQFSDLEKQGIKHDGTALFFACCRGMLELAHLLILHGANLEACTSYGASPLHAAVDHNNIELARLLLGYGADVNAKTKRGDTACHFAAFRGYAPLVQTLAEAGADVTILNSKSQSAETVAASRDHTSIARYLQAVSSLAKYKPIEASIRRRPSLLYQRSVSAHSLTGDNEDNNSLMSVGIPVTEKILNTDSFDDITLEDKIQNNSAANSLVSVHNLCGAQLTQALKRKQYVKDFS